MNRRRQILRLEALTGLILDLRLADLRAAARQREASLAHLRALEPAPAEGLDALAAAQAALRYQHWADQRRAAINLVLARQTAAMLVAQGEARQAFGRAEALKAMRERLEKRLRKGV